MYNICFNCMNLLEGSPVCLNCGFDNSNVTASAPYHLKPGTILAERYLVGKALGEGGFGITYIGLDGTLSKRVAIKEFYPSGAANRVNDKSNDVLITPGRETFFAKGVDRFMLEAKNVASFADEDGIVDVLDYFKANNTAYIVMSYLEGHTLKDYVSKHGLFSADELINLMIPVMKSLNVIHAKGVIHRDISPDNIMYTKSGKLKLMDFGSARYFTNEDRQMSVVLKQGFAPEEQYRRNGHQGPYTDVYALCATIYSCITGIVPSDSLDRLANDTLQPPSQMGIKISPVQERALMHGLALRAENRCRDMNQLISEFTSENSYSTPYGRNYGGNQQVTQQISQQMPTQMPQMPQYTAPQNNMTMNMHMTEQMNGQTMQPNNWQPYRPPARPAMPIPPQNIPPQPPKKQNGAIIAAIIVTVVAILAVGGVIAFVYFSGQNNKSSGSEETTSLTSSEVSEAVPTTRNHNNASVSSESETEHTTHATTEPPTTKPTEPPTTEKPEPTTDEPTTLPTLSNSEIDDITNDIGDDFSDTIKYMDNQYTYKGYAVTKSAKGHTWIASPSTSMKDNKSKKIWYFFDSNDKLYFIYEHNSSDYYRYYVYKDEIVRYTVGDTGAQTSYDHNDSHITRSVKLRVSGAYKALAEIKS